MLILKISATAQKLQHRIGTLRVWGQFIPIPLHLPVFVVMHTDGGLRVKLLL